MPENWLTAIDVTAGTTLRVSFPTPSGPLTGEQQWRLLLRKTAGAPHPVASTISVFQGVTEIGTADGPFDITSTVGQVIEITRPSASFPDVNGANVELLITNTPGEEAAASFSRGFGSLGVGSTDRVEIPTVILAEPDDFSIFCWILAATTQQQTFFRAMQWGAAEQAVIYHIGSSTMRAQRGRATQGHITAFPFTLDGAAHSLLVVWNRTSERYFIYVDGAADSGTVTQAGSGTFAAATAVINWGNRTLGDRVLNGRLDECTVWRRALTQTDAQALHAGADPASLNSPSGPIALYRMDASTDDEILGPVTIVGTTLLDPLF